jgi:hypothetical protein
MKFSMTGQEKGDLLIQPVTSLTDLSVCPNTGDFIDRFVTCIRTYRQICQ